MYELVPPKSKIIEYESPYLTGIIFKIKVFDFEEDEIFNNLLIKNAKKDGDDFLKDKNGNYEIDNEQYYIDCFKLLVKEIKGIKGKFTPSWRVIKNVVNYGTLINTVIDLEK